MSLFHKTEHVSNDRAGLLNRFSSFDPSRKENKKALLYQMRELRNKIMRIGLHGMCGYIKLERGRTGGA